jgi:hypothetical protein
MKVNPENPWSGYPDQLKELVTQAKGSGLTVKLDDDAYFPDAQLFDGGKLLGWVHYDPHEDEWAMENHRRFVCPLNDIFESLKSSPRPLVLTVGYVKGDLPEISQETLEAIKKLLPGKPLAVTASYPAH